jgi:hypothetical protein
LALTQKFPIKNSVLDDDISGDGFVEGRAVKSYVQLSNASCPVTSEGRERLRNSSEDTL